MKINYTNPKSYGLSPFIALSILIHVLVLVWFMLEWKNNLQFKRGGDVAGGRVKFNVGMPSSISQRQEKNSTGLESSKVKQSNTTKTNTQAHQANRNKTSKNKNEKITNTNLSLEQINSKDKKLTQEKNKEFESQEQESAQATHRMHGTKNKAKEAFYPPPHGTKFNNIIAQYPNLSASTKQELAELYGDQLGDFGIAERDFIINNLRDIGRITQYYLRYPKNAIILQQQGTNAVEFYLHPNGDISDLRLIKYSGYSILDENSKRTIEIAYKDYPRPQTRTLIRIFVHMRLY